MMVDSKFSNKMRHKAKMIKKVLTFGESVVEVVTHGGHMSSKEAQPLLVVHRKLAFIKAHKLCQGKFQNNLCGKHDEALEMTERLALHESRDQVRHALEALKLKDKNKKGNAEVSHIFAIILLNKTAANVQSLGESGLLKQWEAGEYSE
jgi:hypothetical protein